MDLNGILSLSGKSGLFKSIAQTKNGLIVESLIDKKRLPAYVSYKVSALKDISVYTNDTDMPLSKIMDLIYENESGGPCIDPKSDETKLRQYFEEVLPDYDKERVYISDIKKLFAWYNILQSTNMLIPETVENA